MVVYQSNLAIRNSLIRNLLAFRNHFPWPTCHSLHKEKQLLALSNNFRATKKFLIAMFDSTIQKIWMWKTTTNDKLFFFATTEGSRLMVILGLETVKFILVGL